MREGRDDETDRQLVVRVASGSRAKRSPARPSRPRADAYASRVKTARDGTALAATRAAVASSPTRKPAQGEKALFRSPGPEVIPLIRRRGRRCSARSLRSLDACAPPARAADQIVFPRSAKTTGHQSPPTPARLPTKTQPRQPRWHVRHREGDLAKGWPCLRDSCHFKRSVRVHGDATPDGQLQDHEHHLKSPSRSLDVSAWFCHQRASLRIRTASDSIDLSGSGFDSALTAPPRSAKGERFAEET